MAELRVFDSQGKAVDGQEVNQTVKDFFFDGVRFALDKIQNQIYCFFRARENETARSEQYYALYEYDSRSEMNNIVRAVKNRIENEHGMILDIENEDVQFFKSLLSINSGKVPSGQATLDEIDEVLSTYQQARLGVGNYDEAYALFSEFSDRQNVDTIAVSDNAMGSSTSSYDLVIEKANHHQLELLDDTADAVEKIRSQQRATFDSEHETSDSSDGISGIDAALLFAGGGILLLIVAAYAGCLGLGMSVPGLGPPPGIGSCGSTQVSGGGTLTDFSAEMNDSTEQTLVVEGNISNITSDTARIGVTISNSSGAEVLTNATNRTVQENGRFNFTVALPVEDMAHGTYTANASYNNMTIEDEFAMPLTENTSTSTPSSTVTETDDNEITSTSTTSEE